VSAWILKLKSDVEHCRAQETAYWSHKENWRAEETNNRDKIIWDWWEDISINEQCIDKEEEQETHE